MVVDFFTRRGNEVGPGSRFLPIVEAKSLILDGLGLVIAEKQLRRERCQQLRTAADLPAGPWAFCAAALCKTPASHSRFSGRPRRLATEASSPCRRQNQELRRGSRYVLEVCSMPVSRRLEMRHTRLGHQP